MPFIASLLERHSKRILLILGSEFSIGEKRRFLFEFRNGYLGRVVYDILFTVYLVILILVSSLLFKIILLIFLLGQVVYFNTHLLVLKRYNRAKWFTTASAVEVTEQEIKDFVHLLKKDINLNG